jgi:CubicO group peptidase (beta-lactamase class C family)
MIDPSLVAPSPESVGIDPAALEALFERAEREVREGVLPSVQIAIARDGKIAGMRTFGRARFGGVEADASDDSLYCIFSCTKAITSAAAWLLIQEGKLSVDEPVATIVPEFGTNGKDAVVVEQLFTHTAGFPTAPFDPSAFLDRERRLAYFAKWRLNFEPGSRFIYHPSSSMYVIAEIIERRSGIPYHDFVRQRIAEPLGLPDLFVGLPDEQHGRAAEIEHRGEELSDADFEAMGFPKPPVTEVTEEAVQRFNSPEVRRAGIPGGGAFTNAHTLALFYQALLSGGRGADGAPIWKPETIAMAREIRNPELTDIVFRKRANRGLGLMIAGDADRTYRGFGHTNSEHAFGHGGAGGQIGWADPATGVSIGYCTNGFDRDVIRQARRGVGISSRAAACAIG